MIAGHFALALAAKRYRTTAPLWLLLVAALGPDIAEAMLELSGAGASGRAMWSHSVIAALVIGGALGLAVLRIARERRIAALMMVLVTLHVLADYVTGRKPSWPGGPDIGLGGYGLPAIDFAIESAVVLVCWLAWRGSLRGDARESRPSIAMLIVLLAAQGAGDVAIHFFGRAIP